MIVAAAVVFSLGFQADQSVPNSTRSVTPYIETLLKILETRDEAVSRIQLPYEATFHVHSKPGKHSVRAEGVWARNGIKQAVKAVHSSYMNDWVRVSAAHSLWDGTQCETLISNEAASSRKLTIKRTLDGAQFHLQLPQRYGLEWCFGPWPATLRRWGAKSLGEEVVTGRTCLKLIFDTSRDGINGSSPNTWLVWLDERETFLVWRCQSLSLPSKLDPTQKVDEGTLATLGVEIHGRTFVPAMDMQLVAAKPMNGVWIPIEATLTEPAIKNSGLTRIVVDSKGVSFDSNDAQAMFSIARDREMLVKDNIRGEEYYIDPAAGEISLLELECERLLTKVSNAWSGKVSERPATAQRLHEASCGPKAAYFWLRLSGYRASVNELLERLPTRASVTDLGLLADYLGRSGADVKPVKLTMDDVRQLSGVPFIAVLKELTNHRKDSKDTNHFIVAKVGGEGVELTSVPEGHYRLTTEEFEKSWTGYAIIDSQALGRISRTPRFTRATRTIMSIVALSAAPLIIFVVLALRKRRGSISRPTIAALSVLLMPIVTGGCSRPPEPSNSKSSEDIGTVQEGELVDVTLLYTNATPKDQNLSLRSSCGCVTTEIAEPLLSPGKSSVIRARVDTLGRSGNLHEFIDIFDSSTRAHSYWIVGKVIPKARVLTPDGSLDLGQVRLNEEISRAFSVAILTNGELMTLSCKVPDSDLRHVSVALVQNGDVAVDSETFKRKFLTDGEIQYRGLKPGQLSEYIWFTAIDKEGKPRNQGKMLVTATIVGDYVVSPMSFFAGAVARAGMPKVVRFKAHAMGSPKGPLTANASSEWIRVSSVTADGADYVITVELDAQKAPGGLFDESILIHWGDTSHRIPVRGRIG